MSVLIVGDVHAVPQELDDCRALLSLIVQEASKPDVERIVFMGDQNNNHSSLDSRCVAFWSEAINTIKGCGSFKSVLLLVGNHDFVNPTIMQPHSMVAHQEIATVIDKPCVDQQFKHAYMPYYPDPVKFVEDAVKLKQGGPGVETLFCHQTFVGADEGKGFYSKDAVESSAVPFKTIISGHIHKPMKLGKVLYVGAPRWRTLTDAEVAKRFIYHMDPDGKMVPITTNNHCVRIYRFEDSEEEPAKINLTEGELKLADIRVTIHGTSEYIAQRIPAFKAQYNAKCRGVPVRGRLVKASESEGIDKAFKKFSGLFVPPNGTDKELLLKETYGRLQT